MCGPILFVHTPSLPACPEARGSLLAPVPVACGLPRAPYIRNRGPLPPSVCYILETSSDTTGFEERRNSHITTRGCICTYVTTLHEKRCLHAAESLCSGTVRWFYQFLYSVPQCLRFISLTRRNGLHCNDLHPKIFIYATILSSIKYFCQFISITFTLKTSIACLRYVILSPVWTNMYILSFFMF